MNRMTNRGQGGMGMIPGGALGKAKFALGSGRPDEAERIARKQLEKDPGNVSARVILAQALLQQRQIDDAIVEARRATSQQSTNVDAQMVLASALLQKNNLMGRISPDAERAAARAVQLQPKSARTHVQLAEVYAAKKDTANAKAEVDRAIELEPRLASAHLMRAMISYQNRDPQGAIQSSDAALRNDRTLTQAELIKANAYVDLKQYDNALVSLDDVARQNALMVGPQIEILRGRIYFKQRKLRQSYAIFREAQAQNPRLKFLAPVIAGINMVLMGFFGQSAQYAWIGLLLAVVLLLLFGIYLIPVVGGWIVSGLVLVILGVVGFGAFRQAQGRILPAGMNPGLSIFMGAVAGLMVFSLVLYIVSLTTAGSHLEGFKWLNPAWVLLAGALGIAASALVLWLLERYPGRTSALAG
ncbi:MAG: tetratricopeptide repeat protein [Ktedonobacterales bacterium]